MRRTLRFPSLCIALTFMPIGLVTASPAVADCTNAGNATVCAQGTVRGGGPTPPSASFPSYCADSWYCGDDWDLDVIVGRPGRPGGIGPR
jgi:hypothetical protein